MKLIKEFLLGFLLWSCVSSVSAQSCAPANSPLPCWYTPSWDWLVTTAGNWEAQIGANSVPMGSPFTSNTNTNDMVKVIDALDYLPEQGWVLFAKDFGCIGVQAAANATPYFILYNKYKGIVRVFLYLGNVNYGNRASVVLKWNNNNGLMDNNSLFTFSNDYAKANEVYPISNNGEKHVNYLNQVTNSGGWVVTEYIVNFDPNTVNNIGNFQRFDFDFNVSNNSAITMAGDFNFTTESATPKNPSAPVVNGNNPSLLDYVITGKKFLGKAPKKSELQSGFTQISSQVTNLNEQFSNKFTQKLATANTNLQTGSLKQFLLGAATVAEGFGGGLGMVATTLEFFMGKSNTAAAASVDSYIQPTISKGTTKFTGTIITESNPLSISIQAPGTSHKFSNGSINCPGLPVYDCPLGVVSLQEAPIIDVRTWNEPVKMGTYNCSIDFFPNSATGCGTPPNQYNQTVITSFPNGAQFFNRSQVCNVPYPNKTLKSYKVTGNVKLALNESAGATIESAQAALVFQIKSNNGIPALDILQSSYPTPASCCNPLSLLPPTCSFVYNSTTPSINSLNNEYYNAQNFYIETVPFKNYAKELLNSNLLNLCNYDATNGLHEFQTPFIDIDKFKNTTITLEEGVNVYLKLLITLKPTNLSHDQTPIVFVSTYELPANKFNAVAGSTPFNMTCDQKLETDVVNLFPGLTYAGGTTSGYALQNPTNNLSGGAAAGSSNVNFEAYLGINIKNNFRMTASGNYNVRAFLNPNFGGCANSASALIVQNYFANCTSSSTDRLAQSFSNDTLDTNNGSILRMSADSQLGLELFPNPNNGNFKLVFSQEAQNGTVKIFDLMGRQIYSQLLDGMGETYEINLEGLLTKGTYFLTWNNSKFVINHKFIVE